MSISKKPLFIININPCDKNYEIIRGGRCCHRASRITYKSCIERLWDYYYPYADSDFPQQLARDFNARFWEMYLTCTLLSKSMKVITKQTQAEGPDIKIQDDNRIIYIEAITPESGDMNNPDRVNDLPSHELTLNSSNEVVSPDLVANHLPIDQVVLRYCGAIADKYKKYQSYLRKRIVTDTDSYIIALNSCKISSAIYENNIPKIFAATLGLQESWNFGVTVTQGLSYRTSIQRSSGSDVVTNIFFNDEYAGLSGILYLHSDFANINNDYIYIHNPKARNRVPNGYFKFGKEYIPEISGGKVTIDYKDWG